PAPGWSLWPDRSTLDLRLLHVTGDLDRLAPSKRGLDFSYSSPLRTIALFNRQPFEIRIDRQPYSQTPVQSYGRWSLPLPRRRPTAEGVADSTPLVFWAPTSLYSSSLIVIFGAVACGLMVLLYFTIIAHRAYSSVFNGRPRSARSSLPE